MSKVWRVVWIVCGILLLLGLAVGAVALLTGGSLSRVLATTDIADMTKFFTREQLDAFLSLFFK